MRKETDLDGVKAIAKALLMTAVNQTPYSPMIVQHPFTFTGLIPFPTEMNKGFQPVDITLNEDNLKIWRESVSKIIDEAENPYHIVYLEDELELLMKHDIIKKIGDKYQTNIIIFTDDYEKQVAVKIKPVYEKVAERFNESLSELLPKLERLDFKGNNYNRNRLKWTFANLVMVFALNLCDDIGRKRFGDYPLLSNGSHGFIFGYDNDYRHHHFNRIYGHCENNDNTAYFSVENYRIIEKCQFWEPVNFMQSVEAMCDAILKKTADPNNDMLIQLISEGFISNHAGKLSAEFPVFSYYMFDNTIWQILKPLAEEICNCMVTICDIAAQTLKNFIPKDLSAQGSQLSFIHHQMDVMAFIIETMVEKNWLVIPDENEKLCVFGVKR